jgi:hypothetical protein
MATVYEHLSVDELKERYVAGSDAAATRHFQVIWLLARDHTVSQVSAMTAFGEGWIEQLLAGYNAEGPEALGDLRRRNDASATILACLDGRGSRGPHAQSADAPRQAGRSRVNRRTRPRAAYI